MIILFHIVDSLGRRHKCSTVCGPSTTAAGAINQLRTKLAIPIEVEVEVHLANEVPIRHLTTPLTSLRKQRRGCIQVLRMQLWASLTGPEVAVQEINYSAAEVADPAQEDIEDSEADEERSSASHSASRSLDCSSLVHEGQPTRIMFSVPPARLHTRPAAAPGVASTTTMHARPQPPLPNGRSAPATSAPADANATTAERGDDQSKQSVDTVDKKRAENLPSEQATTATTAALQERSSSSTGAAVNTSATDTAPTRVLKRREIRPTNALPLEMPLSARGPARRPPAAVGCAELSMPQTARGVVPSRMNGASSVSVASSAAAAYRDPATVDALAAARRTGIANRDAAVGHIIMREYPKVISREPKDIVAAVKDDARLSARSYNHAFTATSDVDGVDDANYARCLSIGLTHGQELRADGAAERARLTLYCELGALRHSCCPNATVLYDLFTAPYAATCRCAVLKGIQKGEEITHLYKQADSLAFLLLSRDRRRNILQRVYFMECDCPRCTEVAGGDEVDMPIAKSRTAKTGTAKARKIGMRTKAQREAEATLTGAFFTDSDVDRDPAKQRQLMEEMRRDFDALQIMDDTGVEINLCIVGNVPPLQRTKQCNRLLSFLRKYGSSDATLRLHDHHWRLNLVRAAYVQETVRLCAVKGATPAARLRDPHSKTLFTPTKTVYDVCLKQLAVEALFIPPGHPHSLTTYESFQYLVGVLPPVVAQTVTRSAQNAPGVKWKHLEDTKEAWSVLKRVALGPQIQKLAQRRDSSGTPEPQPTPPAAGGTPNNSRSESSAPRSNTLPKTTATTTVKTQPKAPVSARAPPAREAEKKS